MRRASTGRCRFEVVARDGGSSEFPTSRRGWSVAVRRAQSVGGALFFICRGKGAIQLAACEKRGKCTLLAYKHTAKYTYSNPDYAKPLAGRRRR